MKPRIAFIGMTSCKGCFFEFLLLGRKIVDIFENMETRNFWMLKEFNDEGGKYDITFMDGAVSTEREAKELKSVRERTKFLVAFGTCACWGGIPSMRNYSKDYRKIVYPKDTKHKSRGSVDPIDKHVKVDYYMRGCPINEEEALDVIMDLLAKKKPREKDFPVCIECKKCETSCLFKDGIICYGPVTYAGCNAPCPAVGTPCDGCRGPLPDGNLGAARELLEEMGITTEELKGMLTKYAGSSEKFKEVKK
ncbi:MAG: oxidoreductase [Candidatus Aenigmarchaeota archaeon]